MCFLEKEIIGIREILIEELKKEIKQLKKKKDECNSLIINYKGKIDLIKDSITLKEIRLKKLKKELKGWNTKR